MTSFSAPSRDDRVPPADPTDIRLRYFHEHHWSSGENDGPEIWHVHAVVPGVQDDQGGYGEAEVGDIEIILFDPYAPDSFGMLDGYSADLGGIGEVVLRPGWRGLHPGLEELLDGHGTRLLILNYVRLAAEWRGFGIGALLAGLAIQRLSGGCQAAVCVPSPLPDALDEEPAEDQDPQAVAKLAQVWSQLGFEHFREGVHVLDLALVTLDEKVAALRGRISRFYLP